MDSTEGLAYHSPVTGLVMQDTVAGKPRPPRKRYQAPSQLTVVADSLPPRFESRKSGTNEPVRWKPTPAETDAGEGGGGGENLTFIIMSN